MTTRLAYVAVTRAKDLLLASGYVWSTTRKKARKQSDFLVELRKAVPPEPQWNDPWDETPGAVNPLLAVAVPDVAWPVDYQQGPRDRRDSAAALVTAALATAAMAEPGGQLAQPSPGRSAEIAGWEREVDQLLDELAAVRSPIHDVALPRTLSASQVVSLADDPDALARSLARPMPRRPSAAARRGTAFHAWVEQLFDARPLFDTDDLTGAGDDEWPDEAYDDCQLADLQKAFARTDYGEATPCAVEAPFELVVAGRLLRGRIDAVYRTGEATFDVVDYKTGLRPAGARAAALQLAIYRLAWAGIAGVPVDSVGAAFLYVRTGELVRPHLATEAEIAALLSGTAEAPGVSSPARQAVPPPLPEPSPEPDAALALSPPVTEPAPPPAGTMPDDRADGGGQLAFSF